MHHMNFNEVETVPDRCFEDSTTRFSHAFSQKVNLSES